MENKCKCLLEHKVWDDYLGCMVTSYYCGAEKEPSPCDHLFTSSHCPILYSPVCCPVCRSTNISSWPFEGIKYTAECCDCHQSFQYFRNGKKVWYYLYDRPKT